MHQVAAVVLQVGYILLLVDESIFGNLTNTNTSASRMINDVMTIKAARISFTYRYASRAVFVISEISSLERTLSLKIKMHLKLVQ